MAASADDLLAIVEPGVEALGFECVGVERGGSAASAVVRVYIDSDRGVTVDDCARVSHQVSGLLDVADPIAGNYVLEVSSPGLDRPLLRERDYARFAGSEVTVRTRAPVDGRRRFRGRLVGLEEGCVIVDEAEARVRLPMGQVSSARLVHEIDDQTGARAGGARS